MTITPIAFVNNGSDIATDADLAVQYPTLPRDIWGTQETYRVQIQNAFNRVLRDVAKNETFEDPDLIPNSADNISWFKIATIEAALSDIFFSFITGAGDRWHLMYQRHEANYKRELDNIKIDYDTDDDGSVDDTKVTSVPEFVR